MVKDTMTKYTRDLITDQDQDYVYTTLILIIQKFQLKINNYWKS